MKQLFLTVLACITAIAGAAQQKTDLEGVWLLDIYKAEIKQITQKGDTVALPYSPDKYANSTDCIYPVLELQSEQATLIDRNQKYYVNYSKNDNTLTFGFSPSYPKFIIESLSENRFVLLRRYEKYDTEKEETVILLIRITYDKI